MDTFHFTGYSYFQQNVFEDMVLATKAFNKLVETYPETIKCEAQNKPITKAFHPSSYSWDSPREILPEEQVITLASGYKSKEVVFLCDSFINNVLSVYEYSSLPLVW